MYSTPVTMEKLSSVSMERMKVQLLQKQSELTATIQAFEEFKEVNKYVHVTFISLPKCLQRPWWLSIESF